MSATTSTRNRWAATVDISGPWRDDDLSLKEKANQITATFRRRFPSTETFAEMDFHDLLDDLDAAGAEDDVDYFDDIWEQIYDWADENRVWIDTFGRAH